MGPDPNREKAPRAPVDTIRAFWERMEGRNWDGARALLADDLVVTWPATREQFRDPDTFIAMNRAYPGDWHISVQRVHADGRFVLAWIEVTVEGERAFCAQQAIVTDRQIRSSIELWVDEGGAEAPAWRTQLMADIATTTSEPAPALNEEAR